MSGISGRRGQFILASGSPRRRSLLESAGCDFSVEPSDVEELTEGNPVMLSLHNAERKARDVAARFPDEVVLGADTVVTLGEEVFGKPADMAHAAAMLGRLAGKVHEVVTGVCLIRLSDGQVCLFHESTRVKFRSLDRKQIDSYLQRIHPLDKAGAYAAQEDGGEIIEHVEGSFDNVVGLPVRRVLEALTQFQT